MARYGARVRAALQQQLRYPLMARSTGEEGRVLVDFVLLNGVASDIHVVQGSGSSLLDQAALATVQDATYPAAPAALEGTSKSMEIWITFKLDQQD